MSKQTKISLSTVNAGKASTIGVEQFAKASERIKKSMKKTVRKFSRNDVVSKQRASKLVLNS